MITHRKYNDPKSVLHSGSVYVSKCPKCGREEANSSFLQCPGCNVKMLRHSVIPEKKTDEIRNRVNVPSPKDRPYQPSPIEKMWDEGLIKKNIRAIVHSVTGNGELKIEGRKNKEMWLNKVVRINGGYFRLSDIGAALKEMI